MNPTCVAQSNCMEHDVPFQKDELAVLLSAVKSLIIELYKGYESSCNAFDV